MQMAPSDPLHVLEILYRLEKAIPVAQTALDHKNSFQLLVATILSAQCTDARVNQVTPILFEQYPSPHALCDAELKGLSAVIRPTGFYQTKAKNLIGCAKGIVARFNGTVPDTLEALVTLPGVGRKTANVILGCVYGKSAIVVDTHVKRVARRLQWTGSSNPDRIEIDLGHLLPQEKWTTGSHRLLLHGRHVCTARVPRCLSCPLFDLCPAESEKTTQKTSARLW